MLFSNRFNLNNATAAIKSPQGDSLFSRSINHKGMNDYLAEVNEKFEKLLPHSSVEMLKESLAKIIQKTSDYIAHPANGTNPLCDAILDLRSLSARISSEVPAAKKTLIQFRDNFLDSVSDRVKGLTTPEDLCIRFSFPLKILAKILPDKIDTMMFKIAEKAQRLLKPLSECVDECKTADGLSDLLVKPGIVLLSVSMCKFLEILGKANSNN